MRGLAPSQQCSLKGPGSEDDPTDIYISKKLAHWLSRNLEHREDTQQVLYDNSESLMVARGKSNSESLVIARVTWGLQSRLWLFWD